MSQIENDVLDAFRERLEASNKGVPNSLIGPLIQELASSRLRADEIVDLINAHIRPEIQ